jgi:hypothetical protein
MAVGNKNVAIGCNRGDEEPSRLCSMTGPEPPIRGSHFGKSIAYFRVSTDRQGKSGLGLDAQREAVMSYLNGGSWTLVSEFTEVESGSAARTGRMLAAAIAACKKQKAKGVKGS